MADASYWLTWLLFALTYAGLALGRVPMLRMDRAGIALVGAVLMLITGQLTFDEAVDAKTIDYRTLALLFGMMIVVAYLRIAGVFHDLTESVLARIHTPKRLLAVTIALSGGLSAFLINDVVCLAMTPIVLHLTRRLGISPIPHLVALATAANIGSSGTITGNPQNIFIGSHSGIPYYRFALRLLPIAAIGLVLNYLVILVAYRRELSETIETSDADDRVVLHDSRAHTLLRYKSVTVTIAATLLFFTGLPLELVALAAASILLVGRVNPAKVFRQVDWDLLVMFTGLFIVVRAFNVHVVAGWDIASWQWLLHRPVDLLSVLSAGLSNLVSNVPAVLLLEPVVTTMPAADRETAWLALAMSSTLAGNLTILGSVANLIVVENACRQGTHVSFWQYSKVGIPLTLVTLAVGIAWLQFVPY